MAPGLLPAAPTLYPTHHLLVRLCRLRFPRACTELLLLDAVVEIEARLADHLLELLHRERGDVDVGGGLTADRTTRL